MKRLCSACVLLAILAASPVLANAPATMSYQGVLTDNAGNLVADGNYNFVFKIYTVPVAGAAIWTETQNTIPVAKGGFNVILGSVTPLGINFNVQYYLGISVNGGAELSPRVVLASSPWALGLHLPFFLSTASGTTLIYGDDYSGYGGTLQTNDDSGSPGIQLQPDVDGTGGFLQVRDGSGGQGFYVDGNEFGNLSIAVRIAGTGSATYFDTNAPGDNSVQLPANAVSAPEILDEPGIASNHVNFVSLAGATVNCADIASVSLTTPAPGYIVVSADAQMQLFTAGANLAIQIDETSNAPQNAYYFYCGGATVSSGTITQNWTPAAIHRVYFKPAGTYTFYFQGRNVNGSATVGAYNSTITALYTPTSYGAVTTMPPAAARSQFEHVTSVAAASNGPGQPGTATELVDLRELELKAARAREASERAQRQLIEAQLGRQGLANAAGVRKP